MSTRFHRGIPIDFPEYNQLLAEREQQSYESYLDSITECNCTEFEVCPQCATYTDEPTC